MQRLANRIIALAAFCNSIMLSLGSLQRNPIGVDLMADFHYQQDIHSVPCIGHIVGKYFQSKVTYAHAVVVINFTKRLTLLSTLLINQLMANSEEGISIVVKCAQNHAATGSTAISFVSYAYLACVNETSEVEATIM